MCCVPIIEMEKLCKENTECKAEQAYVRNQKPVPMIPTTEVQKLEKKKRNTILKQLCEYGASVRQISRVTGISYGVIYRAKSGS